MQPVLRDINIMQGDTRDFFFRVRDRVYNEFLGEWQAGAYTDLTNWTGKSQVRAPGTNQNNLLVEWTVFITNQATTRGGVLLRLTPVQTAGLPPAAGTLAQALAAPPNLVWDVQLTSPTAEVNTFISGGARVLPEVTKL